MTSIDKRGAVLSFRNVRKCYGSLVALNSMDLLVQRGQIMGLLGPNGAGKSTFFQISAGLLSPDYGEVEVFGKNHATDRAEILSQLGVVFQGRSLDLDISVYENLQFHGNLFGLYGRALKRRIHETCNQLEIIELMDKKVRQLSGGNQRRVEIARALLNDPELLLLDEPTTGLDPTARKRLTHHIRTIVDDRGISVLWATHLVHELESADRITLLVKGNIINEGAPVELMRRSGTRTLTDAYTALTGSNQPPEMLE